ncbi:MAG: penicillin acylase family protein [Sphingobacteriales bacterium]|nr:penicillin acylase family protein [Sphingobacteriales bacterium]
MMTSWIKFLAALLFSALFVWTLNTSFIIKGKPLPAVGKLFNPFSGFWNSGESAKALKGSQTYDFPELTGKVTVVYDERLVPHIFAENTADALFVQGYVTAQHRLWQMDFATRAAAGRISEVIGEAAVNFDKEKRRKGMVYAAQNAVEVWKKDAAAYTLVEQYSAGVNAYIQQLAPKDYPVEYKILDYAPEAWSPLKTALFFKSMAETLCSEETDAEASNTLRYFGKPIFDFLYPEYFPQQSPVVPDQNEWKNYRSLNIPDSTALPAVKAAAYRSLPAADFNICAFGNSDNPYLNSNIDDFLQQKDMHAGSNNWAVAAWKTKNGNPILCNDPHLQLSLPAIWYEIQIHTPQSNAYGVSLPGIPGIIIGFNEYIAWGETNLEHDVSDWYNIQWKNAARNSYIIDGQEKPVQWVVERIAVRGKKEALIDSVRYTQWGPVVYEDSSNIHQNMALHWLAHEKSNANELVAFVELAQAKNYNDYVKAIGKFGSPPQNIVFACKDGDIALTVQGQLPIKNEEQGRFVQAGNDSKNAWHGFIPNEQLPRLKNPERGFVSSANQHSTTPDYPYYYNGGFDHYRGRYLNRRLAEMDSITVDDMKRLQTDAHSIKAEEALPLLMQFLEPARLDAAEKPYAEMLQGWNYSYEADKVAPIIFETWFDEYYKMLWDENLSVRDTLSILMPETYTAIALLRDHPQHFFFDTKATPVQETAKDIVTLSFKSAVKIITDWKTANPQKNLNWAEYRNTHIPHLAKIEAFSEENIQCNGTKTALNAVQTEWAPSWRMVVELGNPIKAWGVYPGGQSGNPFSSYYRNFVDTWSKGEYYELNFWKSPEDAKDKVLMQQNFE